MQRIVYTRHDGGVTVCCPAPECLSWLSEGGYWAGRGIDTDEQIERQVAAGHYEWAARRFVRAMDKGGCTTAEAYEIIRDRDCAHLGSGFDVCDFEDLPDRWFRDAWIRSHNGGPIMIDMRKARKVQFQRIKRLSPKRMSLKLPLWRERIRKASSPDELRRIWPG